MHPPRFLRAGTSTSYTVTLTAEGASPIPRLSGPSGDVYSNQPIVLNALASMDPDTGLAGNAVGSALTFTWSCARADSAVIPCFTTAAQGDSTTTPGVWTIPGQCVGGSAGVHVTWLPGRTVAVACLCPCVHAALLVCQVLGCGQCVGGRLGKSHPRAAWVAQSSRWGGRCGGGGGAIEGHSQ